MTNETPKIAPIIVVEYYDDRFYKILKDGKYYWCPSVTTKLGIVDKPSLDRWRADIGQREADLRSYEASQRGKRIHWAQEVLLKGGAVVYDPWQNPVYTKEGIAELEAKHGNLAILRTQDEMVQIHKIQRQLAILKPTVQAVELKVYDLEKRDAGSIDAVYWIEEGDYAIAGRAPLHLTAGFYINDLKTGQYVDDDFWLQLSAYAWMFEQLHGVQVAGALITHVGAKTVKGIAGLNTLLRGRQELIESDYPAYRHAAALWERKHKDIEPDQYEFPALITLGG